MKLNKVSLISLGCILVLAGCSQGEQKSETGGAPTGSTTGASTGQDSATQVYEGTIKGVISDSMCGLDHAAAIKGGQMGKDDVDCTLKCVEGGSRFVLADKANNVVYDLSDQDAAKKFAGKPVKIEGHIDPANKSIHVHSVTAE